MSYMLLEDVQGFIGSQPVSTACLSAIELSGQACRVVVYRAQGLIYAIVKVWLSTAWLAYWAKAVVGINSVKQHPGQTFCQRVLISAGQLVLPSHASSSGPSAMVPQPGVVAVYVPVPAHAEGPAPQRSFSGIYPLGAAPMQAYHRIQSPDIIMFCLL